MMLHFQLGEEGRRGGWPEYKYIMPDFQRRRDSAFTGSLFQACDRHVPELLSYSGFLVT
jgi:hypothetical protein